MAGFQIQVVGGVITEQARQRADGSWAIEVDTAPARLTGIPGSERLTVTNAVVVGLSPPGGATHALVSVETNSIRFYDTGDTPTAANGFQVDPGTWYEADLANLLAFKMIAISASAIVQVMYRRYGA